MQPWLQAPGGDSASERWFWFWLRARPILAAQRDPTQGSRRDGRCLSYVPGLNPQKPSDVHDDALLRRLAECLVEESACELRTESGQEIEFWFISADDVTVLASAPRLDVRAGLRLEWRTHLDGRPIIATIVADDAAYQSERRARVRLTLVHARSEPKRRRHSRRGLTARAVLTAINCSAIVDGDWIPATLADLSDSGVGLTTTDTRPRPGDRFRLDFVLVHARVQTDVRVTRLTAYNHGRNYLGCSVIAGSREFTDQIGCILRRLDGAQESAA